MLLSTKHSIALVRISKKETKTLTLGTKGEGFILWIFVALEAGIALICAFAPVPKPLFRRYLNNASNNSSNHGFWRRAPKSSQRADHLETGRPFRDACQVPIELGSVDHSNIIGETQKPLPATPHSESGLSIKKDDGKSGESVLMIQ